jgi:hypothetical protein
MTSLIYVLALTAAELSLSGKWEVHQNISGNESKQTCMFTQAGDELTGTCETANGKVQIAGKVKEAKVTWSFKSEYNGTPLTVNYNGSIESNKISGIVAVPEFSVDGDFTATQAK